MKHITIIVPEGNFSLVNIEGTHHLFNWVNEFLIQSGKHPLFRISLAGYSHSTTQPGGLYTIHPDLLIDEVKKTDLIVIPAIHGKLENIIEMNAALIPWIRKQYKEGAEIASLCVGSFFLASTGLLNGKACSTHWHRANEFRRLFPEVILRDDKIVTEEDGIYTSGGAFSFTNLLIYLVEKFAGREVAIIASKAFMIDIERHSQSPFTIFTGQKGHQDRTILNAQHYIENNYQERITVDELSGYLNIGRRSFERRFKKATSNTVVEYIQRVKIEAAKKKLENGRKTVNEVMFDVGYTDTKAFREVFRKITGMSPVSYRNKYNKEAVVV